MLGLLPTELWEYKFSDIIRGFSAMLNPGNPSKILYIQGLGNAMPIRSARAALIIAMKALDLRPGARIGVPLHCCPVVFKAIKAADYKPRFLDIDPKTFCISPEDLSTKSSKLDAIIAVHMFGNLCDMTSLREAMKGKPIIEDCAQSLGSKLDGLMAGSFGEVAAFSFRSGKYLSVGEGGALFSGDSGLSSRISKMIAAMPAPTRKKEYAHVFETYIRSKLRSKPLYGLVGYPLWRFYNKKAEFAEKSPIVLSRVFRTDLAILRNRLNLLDSMIEAQRANAEYYTCTLQLDPSMLCLERPGTFYNRFMYPITFPSPEQRDLIAAYLQSQMIGTSKPYEEVIEGAAKHYGYEGDCPVAEHILRRALVIPSYYKLKKKDIERIAQCVNKGWTDFTNRGYRVLH
jgi:perosamine synthetase